MSDSGRRTDRTVLPSASGEPALKTVLEVAPPSPDGPRPLPWSRDGFRWRDFDAYLFDIDGTLLNSRDAVHYFAFGNALRDVYGLELRIDGVPVHGNTDLGILRAVLERAGMPEPEWRSRLPALLAHMRAGVAAEAHNLRPEPCLGARELLEDLHARGKTLGAASGNLAAIGWMKLEAAGLRDRLRFGSFSDETERRVDIVRRGIDMAREIAGPDASVCVVGDTPADIVAARRAGAPVIAVSTGVYGWDELRPHEPDLCIACFPDLLEMVDNAVAG